MNKNELKKKQKRKALLDSAYHLFTTVGFHKTTILDISRRARVGKGTFYLYFKDKDDIRNELIMIKSTRILTDAVNEVEATEKIFNSFTDRIIFITDYIITFLSRDIALLKFVSKSLSWGLFFDSEKQRESDDIIDFREFVMGMLESEGIELRHAELLIFTIIELISSTCYSVILNGEPVTLSEYKPYLYENIRLMVDNALKTDIEGSTITA